MAYWLVKSEPSVWSWDQQVAKGAKGEAWTGVRNFTARNHLKAMKKGDRAFIYHTGDEKGVFLSVDVKAGTPLPKPVTLAAVKADKKLADMALVKYGRLSVQPVTDAEWKAVCRMGGLKD